MKWVWQLSHFPHESGDNNIMSNREIPNSLYDKYMDERVQLYNLSK